MEVLEMAVLGAVSILSFIVGAKIGQSIVKGETIKMPDLNPINAIREKNDKKQAEWEQDRLNTILQNIETYDGTGRGQEDVPGR